MHELLVVARSVIVLLAGLLAYLSLRRQHRNHSRAMLFLALGFGLIGIGALTEGVLFEFLRWALQDAFTVGSALEALALVSITVSIYGTRG